MPIEPRSFSQTAGAKVPTQSPQFRDYAGNVLRVESCEFVAGEKGEFARLKFRTRSDGGKAIHTSNTSAQTILGQLHAMTPADYPFVALLVLDGRRLYFTDAPAPSAERAERKGGTDDA